MKQLLFVAALSVLSFLLGFETVVIILLAQILFRIIEMDNEKEEGVSK